MTFVIQSTTADILIYKCEHFYIVILVIVAIEHSLF